MLLLLLLGRLVYCSLARIGRLFDSLRAQSLAFLRVVLFQHKLHLRSMAQASEASPTSLFEVHGKLHKLLTKNSPREPLIRRTLSI